MKKLLLPILGITLLASCSKDVATSNTNPSTGSLSYTQNGRYIKISNLGSNQYIFMQKQLKALGLPNTRYFFNGVGGSNNFFSAAIITDSLKPMQYNYDSSNVHFIERLNNMSTIDGLSSTLYFSGDYMKINVTSYQNGKVSGTFRAKLTPSPYNYNTRGTIMVENGVFNDLQIVY